MLVSNSIQCEECGLYVAITKLNHRSVVSSELVYLLPDLRNPKPYSQIKCSCCGNINMEDLTLSELEEPRSLIENQLDIMAHNKIVRTKEEVKESRDPRLKSETMK